VDLRHDLDKLGKPNLEQDIVKALNKIEGADNQHRQSARVELLNYLNLLPESIKRAAVHYVDEREAEQAAANGYTPYVYLTYFKNGPVQINGQMTFNDVGPRIKQGSRQLATFAAEQSINQCLLTRDIERPNETADETSKVCKGHW
jgi:hypothetical protein